MFCSQLKRVDFVFNCRKNVPLYIETLTSGETVWQKILPQIEFFFRNVVVPELSTHKQCLKR